jgi:hypothetical protein
LFTQREPFLSTIGHLTFADTTLYNENVHDHSSILSETDKKSTNFFGVWPKDETRALERAKNYRFSTTIALIIIIRKRFGKFGGKML